MAIQETHGIPPDLVVRVNDHDVHGVNESRLIRECDGKALVKSVWTLEDSFESSAS